MDDTLPSKKVRRRSLFDKNSADNKSSESKPSKVKKEIQEYLCCLEKLEKDNKQFVNADENVELSQNQKKFLQTLPDLDYYKTIANDFINKHRVYVLDRNFKKEVIFEKMRNIN